MLIRIIKHLLIGYSVNNNWLFLSTPTIVLGWASGKNELAIILILANKSKCIIFIYYNIIILLYTQDYKIKKIITLLYFCLLHATYITTYLQLKDKPQQWSGKLQSVCFSLNYNDNMYLSSVCNFSVF